MLETKEARIYEKEEYIKVLGQENELTVSDCNKNWEKKKLSENSTGTDSENKSQSKENIENQESSNLITNSEFDSSKNNGIYSEMKSNLTLY